MPHLLDVHLFYYDMYVFCGSTFLAVKGYCELYELSRSETLEALDIIGRIHADYTT